MFCDPYSSTPTFSTSSSSTLSYSVHPSQLTELKLDPSTPTKKLRRPTSSKYKGVVPQPNGRWGAQLYQDSKRVWIGTFECQEEAAHAYDKALIRFRGPQAITNFPIRLYSKIHLKFLASHSDFRIIEMLRNHTYGDELARFMRAHILMNRARRMAHVGSEKDWDPNSGRVRLFEKVMTPSDVGKLHRLAIPKHHAESYLPEINDVKGIMLCFEDKRRDKMWKFKYCYWKSSQNYVLTKGWGEFVKEKGLRPGDSVVFYSTKVGCERRFSIDTKSKQDSVEEISDPAGSGSNVSGEVELLSNNILRLFGVDICPSTPVVSTVV